MINNPLAQTLSAQQLKRRFGVQRKTFKAIVKALAPLWRVEPKLDLAARVSLTLEFWREYATYFHFRSSWGVHESTVCPPPLG